MIWGCSATKKKGCQSPSSIYTLSHAEITSLGQLLRGKISCGAATTAVPAQGRCRTMAVKPPDHVFACCQSCEMGKVQAIVPLSLDIALLACLISIMLPGLPIAQISLMNTVLCGLRFIIPHIPPPQFCTR